MFLCGIVLIPQARDPSAMPRYIIWCVMVLLLVGTLKVGKIHIFALGYLICTILSGLNAVNKSEWLYVMLTTALMVIYLSVHIDKKLLAKSMILLGVLFAVWFWIEACNTGRWDVVAGKFLCSGPMRQENLFSATCFFMIPFCMYAIKEGFWKRISYIVITAMSVNILLIQARGVYLAVFIIFLSYLCYKLFKKTSLWFIVLSLFSVSGLAAAVYIFPFDDLVNTDSLRMRFQFWAVTLDMITKGNVCGIGAGNWLIEYPHYAQNIDWSWLNDSVTPANLVPKHPHNDFLWIWSEIGLTGFLCYIGMIGYALWSARKQAYLLVGITGYIIISCFSGLRERPFAGLILMTYITLACERTIPIRKTDLITTVLIFAIVVFGFRLRASCYNKNLQTGTWGQVEEKFKAYSVFSTLSHAGVPWHWWSGMYHFKVGNKPVAITRFKKAYEYNPYSIHVLGGMGKAAMLEGKNDLAKSYFKKVLGIYPEDKEAKEYLGILK